MRRAAATPARLALAGCGGASASRKVVSHGDFAATHLSVLSDSVGAQAAFWDTADALVAGVR